MLVVEPGCSVWISLKDDLVWSVLVRFGHYRALQLRLGSLHLTRCPGSKWMKLVLGLELLRANGCRQKQTDADTLGLADRSFETFRSILSYVHFMSPKPTQP